MADKILIVDDSVSMRQMEKIILTQAGYEVIEASDGEQALSALTPDVKAVVTDYNMPNMTGVEFIKAVRQGNVHKSVPILMVTTESEQDKKQEGKAAGATGWLTKPFEQEQLVNAIRKISESVQF